MGRISQEQVLQDICVACLQPLDTRRGLAYLVLCFAWPRTRGSCKHSNVFQRHDFESTNGGIGHIWPTREASEYRGFAARGPEETDCGPTASFQPG